MDVPLSAACLRVSTAARAKALGFPADDRATAVRMRDRGNIFLFSAIFHSMCSWFPSESRVQAVAILFASLFNALMSNTAVRPAVVRLQRQAIHRPSGRPSSGYSGPKP